MQKDAEPLAMTVHAIPAAALDGLAQSAWSGRIKMALILLVCAAPVVASYAFYYAAQRSGGSAAYGALIEPTVAIPDLRVRDLENRAVPLRSLKGQWLLVMVGPAQCDAACEQRLYLQRQLREMMGRDRHRIDKVWLVTDDAPVRPELKQAIGGDAPVSAWRVPREQLARWLRPADGLQLEDHLYIVDPMGEWMMRQPAKPDPAKTKRDLDRLLRASASWDQPGR